MIVCEVALHSFLIISINRLMRIVQRVDLVFDEEALSFHGWGMEGEARASS